MIDVRVKQRERPDFRLNPWNGEKGEGWKTEMQREIEASGAAESQDEKG